MMDKVTIIQERRGGYILLAVIGILILAAALAAMATANARLEASLVRGEMENSKMRLSIKTAIARALFYLGEDDGFIANGEKFTFELDDLSFSIRLVDDAGLISLNNANTNLLERLIASSKLQDIDAKALADAIVDWRDADDDPLPFGAESRTYANRGLPSPGNRAFAHVTELRRVVGMTDEIFFAISPLLSVSSRQEKPDLQFAPLTILDILDLSFSELNSILDARKSGALLPSEVISDDERNKDQAEPTQDSSLSGSVFHAFVEVQSENKVRRAERLLVRISPETGKLDLYARQVIDYGTADQWFEERDD